MLNIGCGESRIDEFLNIDCRATMTTDMVATAWDLTEIPDGSVEYIYARHMFEHLSRGNAARTLAEWRRVLQVGGIVHIVVPDILFHARQLLGLVASSREDQEQHALAGFYGWQNDDDTDVHRCGYTRASIENLLGANGFRITERGIAQLVGLDPEPWHINVCAEVVQ